MTTSTAALTPYATPATGSVTRSVESAGPDPSTITTAELVHGAPWPVHEVDAARHRLRE